MVNSSNWLASNRFLVHFMAASHMLRVPANQDTVHTKMKLSKLFPSSIDNIFTDPKTRRRLAIEFAAARLFSGQLNLGGDYIQFPGSYTGGISQIDYVEDSAHNLAVFCDVVDLCGQAVLREYLNF